MASPLLLAPAEDPALHNLFGRVYSSVRQKIIQLLLLPDRNWDFFERQVFNFLILTGENHE
jgi:hypothetical protein